MRCQNNEEIFMLDKIAEQYYTAAQARSVLGLNENTFQNWVKAGRIKRTKLPGRGQGLYLRRDIDRTKHLIESALFLDASGDLVLRGATPADVDGEIHLAHLIYGRRAIVPEAQRARRRLVEVNAEASWYLFDRDLFAASINIVPVTPEAIEQFKQGVRGWLFVPSMVRQFLPGEPLDCIVIDYMTTPTVPPEKRKFYGEALLRELAYSTFKDWGARGVELRKVYACGSTPAGRALLRSSGAFNDLGEPVPGRVIFELDVASSDLVLLRPYKEAYKEAIAAREQ
jgi:hypothetical protein